MALPAGGVSRSPDKGNLLYECSLRPFGGVGLPTDGRKKRIRLGCPCQILFVSGPTRATYFMCLRCARRVGLVSILTGEKQRQKLIGLAGPFGRVLSPTRQGPRKRTVAPGRASLVAHPNSGTDNMNVLFLSGDAWSPPAEVEYTGLLSARVAWGPPERGKLVEMCATCRRSFSPTRRGNTVLQQLVRVAWWPARAVVRKLGGCGLIGRGSSPA